MATPARTRIHLAPPPEATVVFDNAPIPIRRVVTGAARQFAAFVVHMWRVEPTAYLELTTWAFVASWSQSFILFRTGPLPVSIAEQMEREPYFPMAVLGLALAIVQLVAMISRRERPRAYCSACTAIWLGGLAFSLLAGDLRAPSGPAYLLLSFLALLPFWKVRRGHCT